MAGESQFTVTSPEAPMVAVDPELLVTAERLAGSAAAHSPVETGRLAGGYYTVRHGPAWYAVRNDVEYWKYVEFGTAEHGSAQPAMGRALAEARARLGSAAP